jgi:hypothetical protein
MTRDTPRAADALAAALAGAGFQTDRATIGAQQVLVARRSEFRWEWIATRLHTFVVVFALDGLAADRAEELTSHAQEYAIQHKGGLPRGLQNGTVTIPVFLCRQTDEETERWFGTEPKHRYAAMCFPVLAEPDAAEPRYFNGRWTRGGVYASYVVGIVRDLIAPALRGDG